MIALVSMNNSSRNFAFAISVGIVTLVACGGGNRSDLGPEPNVSAFKSPAVSLNGESLYATDVHVHDQSSYSCSDGVGSIDVQMAFSAKGRAKGPYPGTFTAKGDWYYFPEWVSGPPASFAESFTIRSKALAIRGDASANLASPRGMTCRHFASIRAKAIKWKISGGNGWLKVPMIRRDLLEQTFY